MTVNKMHKESWLLKMFHITGRRLDGLGTLVSEHDSSGAVFKEAKMDKV